MEEFDLGRLASRYAVLCALLEAERPLSPEQLSRRLSAAGVVMSPQAIRRNAVASLARLEDGRIDVNRGDPNFFEATCVLHLNYRYYRPRPEIPVPPERPWLETQPVGREELDALRQTVGRFTLGQMYGRRELLLYCESRGGRASFDELCQDVRRYSRRSTWPGRGSVEEEVRSSLGSGRDGALEFDRQSLVAYVNLEHPATRTARRMFREGACREMARAAPPPGSAPCTSRVAIVRAFRWRRPFAVVYDVRDDRYTDYADPRSLGRDLVRFTAVAGCDPALELKQFGVRDELVLDYIPFQSRQHGFRRDLNFTVGGVLSCPSELRELADRRPQQVSSVLRREAWLLHGYFRFGMLHGYVFRSRQGSWTRVPVAWSEGQPRLADTLESAIATGQAVGLRLRGDRGPSELVWVQPRRLVDRILEACLTSGETTTMNLDRIVDIAQPQVRPPDPNPDPDLERELTRQLLGTS